jgi:hypothetical protein
MSLASAGVCQSEGFDTGTDGLLRIRSGPKQGSCARARPTCGERSELRSPPHALGTKDEDILSLPKLYRSRQYQSRDAAVRVQQ